MLTPTCESPPMRLVLACSLAVCLALLSGLGACTQFPELDGTVAPTDADAPAPDLVPLAPLLAQANQGSDTASAAQSAQTALTPRLAALRARADRLRGPVIPAAIRARMLRGVQ